VLAALLVALRSKLLISSVQEKAAATVRGTKIEVCNDDLDRRKASGNGCRSIAQDPGALVAASGADVYQAPDVSLTTSLRGDLIR
jgi:hypothetical protein